MITVDLARLPAVRDLDERSGLVTVGRRDHRPRPRARRSRPAGLTVGHEPQSWELATSAAGSRPAAPASGASAPGGSRQLYAGGTPRGARPGRWTWPPYPASAAGPDLRQLVLGSEGRLGFLTDVDPARDAAPRGRTRFDAWALPGWPRAWRPTRELSPDSARASRSLRLSTPAETRTLLAFADRPSQTRALGDATSAPGAARSDWALLLVGVVRATPRRQGRPRRGRLDAPGARRRPRSRSLARAWYRTRFRSPYLRNALWTAGYGADTLETATDWAHVPGLLARLEASIAGALAPARRAGPRVHAPLARLPVRLQPLPDVPVPPRRRTRTRRWTDGTAIKRAASDVISSEGATITHHHGVGRGPRAVPRRREGPAGHGGARRRSSGPSIRTG